MSGSVTKKLIALYEEMASPTMFLSNFFQSPPRNFYNSETVEIDIQRSGESIAIAVQNVDAGYRSNTFDDYTNKEFKPPIFKESFPVNATDMYKRQAGDNPFQDPRYVASALKQFITRMALVEDKIRRTIELQAAQIFETGTVDLIDENGNTIYTIDFKPKATHFPNASAAWDTGSAAIVDDLLALANVIRNDCRKDVIDAKFGEDAWEVAIKDDDFKARYETRRMDLGRIVALRPGFTGGTGGGNYRGTLDLGNYSVNLWTYGGRYDHPQTGASTQFINPKKVTLSAPGRLDATFGNWSQIVAPDQRVLPYLRRIRRVNGALDLHPHAWVSADGDHLFGAVRSRPLLIPTAIDTFGTIDTLIS